MVQKPCTQGKRNSVRHKRLRPDFGLVARPEHAGKESGPYSGTTVTNSCETDSSPAAVIVSCSSA